MKKDGYLYATVPSFSFLGSAEDDLAGHFRRYTLEDMYKLLKSSGFDVVFSSYIFRLLPIPIFLLRSLPYKIGLSKKKLKPTAVSRDHAVKSGLTVNILNAILKPEINNLNDRRPMRFGGSCLIVAKSP